jgi:Ala-tRNA(Pro) deacylase
MGGIVSAMPIVPLAPAAPLTPEQLFRRLDALGIAHRTISRPPVFAVAEAAAPRGQLPGGHCKSIFLKDKKGGFWLAVMLEERRIDLKKLAVAPRFSFGAAVDLEALSRVRPVNVRPFALVNDVGHRVLPVLDRAMLDLNPLNYHPLANDARRRSRPLICCGSWPPVAPAADCRYRGPRPVAPAGASHPPGVLVFAAPCGHVVG